MIQSNSWELTGTKEDLLKYLNERLARHHEAAKNAKGPKQQEKLRAVIGELLYCINIIEMWKESE